MKTESDFQYISTFGIILMLVGAFVTADGITEDKITYIAMGLVLFGFSIYLGLRALESVSATLLFLNYTKTNQKTNWSNS